MVAIVSVAAETAAAAVIDFWLYLLHLFAVDLVD